MFFVSEKANPTYEELQQEIVTLKQLVQRLEARLIEQDKRIEHLENELAKYKKNSSNSSKPPSSDIVKPPRQSPGDGKRKIGGQPGHPRHERPLFSLEDIDSVHAHTLDACPGCGGALLPSDAAPRVIQQVEIIEKPVRIDEHRGMAYWCASCRKVHYAALPREVEKGGMAGPRLTALVAYMKGGCHASFSTIRAFLRDVAGVSISRGQLVKMVGKAADALDAPYRELLNNLAAEPRINVDETTHRENKDTYWTWCFRADLYVLFRIDKSRGSKVLIDVLGREFDGVLGSDYFWSYRKYMKECGVMIQFCIAHLIRDIKFLITLPDKPTEAYGNRLLDAIRDMFHVIHQRDTFSQSAFLAALQAKRERILAIATTNVPDAKAARNMAGRFINHGAAYFQFITTPGMSPTNNLAEQAIRFIVIDRLITQGTRSENGRRWCERIWTIIATCAIQKQSPFVFLQSAIQAHFSGKSPPSLLPSTP